MEAQAAETTRNPTDHGSRLADQRLLAPGQMVRRAPRHVEAIRSRAAAAACAEFPPNSICATTASSAGQAPDSVAFPAPEPISLCAQPATDKDAVPVLRARATPIAAPAAKPQRAQVAPTSLRRASRASNRMSTLRFLAVRAKLKSSLNKRAIRARGLQRVW